MFPIGYIYISTSNTNPGSIFGGTWEAIQGKFLLAADDTYQPGTTGGEATHTLTIDEMPSHGHKTSAGFDSQRGHTVPLEGAYQHLIFQDHSYYGSYTQTSGGDQPHNNMPPYLSVYMWQKTANES